ncbi:hypothetical protein PN36_07435 [Candidatus Thiomargarita nelsonii]|uniref:Response regulatory domain-containing protein n=1 Tax=Candidatus Thiomargarita nelsonii TaxID=1003181 RepID=A0A0A6PHM8_9GAMM|nr:hypothetical protein PN36_07435 [Candidatus Thiomargarita nelsonii]
MFQGIFIDQLESDKKFAQLMSSSGRLQMRFQKSTELMKLAKGIMANSPDLVALDYRLNDGYKAGPLAQQLRDQALETVTKDFPIILVSSEDDLKAFSDNVTVHNLFDRRFSKERLGKPHRLEILSLAKGYKHLIKHWNKKERWATFLGLSRQ